MSESEQQDDGEEELYDPYESVPDDYLDTPWVNIETVEPNDWNPNEMSGSKRAELRDSIRQVGWTQPIVVRPAADAEDAKYEIVDGEQRWFVAQRDQIKENTDLTPPDTPEGHVPIFEVTISEEHAKTATIQHNKARGTLDANAFRQMLNDLDEKEFEIAKQDLPFSNNEITKLTEEVTASGTFGAEHDYDDTWRPTSLEDAEEKEDDYRSATDDVDETRETDDGEKTESIVQIHGVLNEVENNLVRSVLGYSNAANRFMWIVENAEEESVTFGEAPSTENSKD
jgi:ParB-like chromosome segregation protein Spo0J